MSSEKLLDKVTQKYQDAYRKRTLKSREAFESARKYMPGGDTQTSIFFWPYPIWIEKAEGCQITDVDGNEYIDFHNCYTTLVLGHANPRVMAAVREQLLTPVTANTFIAIEHLVLMATALGLGTCWVGGFDDASEFNRLFGLADNLVPVAILPVGYPATKLPPQRPRLSLEEIVLKPKDQHTG